MFDGGAGLWLILTRSFRNASLSFSFPLLHFFLLTICPGQGEGEEKKNLLQSPLAAPMESVAIATTSRFSPPAPLPRRRNAFAPVAAASKRACPPAPLVSSSATAPVLMPAFVCPCGCRPGWRRGGVRVERLQVEAVGSRA